MRVIAGKYRGRRLHPPTWAGLRPTSDRLKETLFAILAPVIEGARVLDGCAGSGALGIEALSRGAADVLFVDADRRALELVEANLRHCGISGGYAMIRGELAAVVDHLPAGRAFDLALLDPPYGDTDVDGMLLAVSARLADGGLLVLEHAARRRVAERAGPLARYRDVKAGAGSLAFYRRGPDAAPAVTEDV
jgi:16S rRNA (guanine(966)-N(2))-methyltransferase RsmD